MTGLQTSGIRRAPVRRGALVALLALALALTTAGGTVTAQDATPVPGPGTEPTRMISVSGRGSVDVTPDTAQIEVGVTETSTSLEQAQDQVSTRLETIISTLGEQGIAEDDIQTSSYNVQINYEFDDNGNIRGISGYTVSSTLGVTVRSLDTLGTILDSVVGAGANLVYGVTFTVDDPTAPASQARRLAVEDARTKAEELAAAANVSIIGVLSIQESSFVSAPPQPFDRGVAEAAMDSAISAVPVQPGSTEVSIDVVVVFEITADNG